MARDAAPLEADAVRAAPLEAQRVAPVVEHRPLAARRDEEQDGGWPVRVLVRREGLAHVVRRVRRARAVRPRAADLPAVADGRRRAGRSRHGRAAEVPVAEELGLGVLLEQRTDLQRVRRGETEAPGGRRAAARDRHDDPQEGWEVDLVPAVAPGHEHAVEAGPQELLVHLLPVVGTCLRLSLALDEERPQRVSPGKKLGRGQIGLGRRDRRGCRHMFLRAARSRSVASTSTARFSGSSSGSPVTTTP